MEEQQQTGIRELVEYLAKVLVDNPDEVRVTEVPGTHTSLLELVVDKTDIGKVIGKKGKTINAIRTIVMSVSSRAGMRVTLEVLEPEDAEADKV